MDVNPERAEDVLEHKKFLELARKNTTGPPIVHVRSIHVSFWLLPITYSEQYKKNIVC